MNTLSQLEIDEINTLSNLIDNNQAEVKDYQKYEILLLKAGLTQDQITSKMKSYGYQTFNQYYDARKNPVSKEHRKVLNVIIVAGLVVLSSFVLLLIASGKLLIRNEKK